MNDNGPLSPLVVAVVRALPGLLREHPELKAELLEALADGAVNQRELPSGVPARAYLAACRDGEIPGAVKRGKLWVAERKAVLAWWMRRPEPVRAEADEALIEHLRAQGLDVDASKVAASRAGR